MAKKIKGDKPQAEKAEAVEPTVTMDVDPSTSSSPKLSSKKSKKRELEPSSTTTTDDQPQKKKQKKSSISQDSHTEPTTNGDVDMDTAHVMETTEPIESPKKRSKKKRDSEQESQKYSSPSKSKSKSKSKTEDPIAEDTDTAKEPLTQPSTSTDPKPKPKKSKDKSKKKQSTDETSSPTAPNPIPEPTETPIEPTNDTTTSTKDQNTPASPEKKKPKRDKHRLREPKPPAPTEPAPEPTKPKQKKRKNKTEFPDPLQDESLSEQSQKALDYAFLKSNSPSDWKFNKARQNWLIRNVWSTESIPDDHLPLTLKYLSSVQGGSRDKLKETCTTILNPPIIPAPTSIETTVEDKPTELVKSILKGSTNTDPSTPTPDSATKPKAGALIEVPKEAPKVDHKPKRAKAILDALRESS